MNRRQAGRWTLAVAGTVAATAGAGIWRWRDRPEAIAAAGGATDEPAAPAPRGGGSSAVDAGLAAFWQARFTQPDGRLLEMAALRGAPLVVNFWATWCPPCLKEMPELDRFAREFAGRGVRVVGLAIDNPSAVNAYLAKTPVSYAIGLAGFDGSELTRRLGNNNGALPFTAVFARNGALKQRKQGTTSRDELAGWIERL